MRNCFALTLVALVGALAAAAQTARPSPPATVEQALAYLPDDAHLVVVIPSVEALASGLAEFGRAIGVEDLAQVCATDLLARVLDKEIGQLDSAGPLVVALSARDEEALVIASLPRLPAGEVGTGTEEPLQTRIVERGGEYFATVTAGNIAVFARERGRLQRVLRADREQRGPRLSPPADLLARNQIAVAVNVKAWDDVLRRELRSAARTAFLGMPSAGPDTEAAEAMLQWAVRRAESILGEAETCVAAVRVDPAGIRFEQRVTFKPDGGVTRYLRGVSRPPRDLWRGVVAEGVAIAFASEWELPPDQETINEAAIRAMMRLDRRRGQNCGEAREAALRRSLAAQRYMTGYSTVVSAAPQGTGMVVSGVYLTTDAQRLQNEIRAIYTACPELMEAWGTFRTTEMTHEQVTLAGTQADVYRFGLGSADLHMQPLLLALYGAESSLCMAPHPAGAAYVLGPATATRASMERLLDSSAPRLSDDPRVRDLMANLSPQPQACVFADAAQSYELARSLLRSAGFPMPMPTLPTGAFRAPLLGAALYLDADGIRGEARIPAEALKQLIRAFQRFDETGAPPY